MWLPFRRRLDHVQPYCSVASHTQEEVRAILLALEQIYQAVFPALNLRKWTGAISTWLTHPLLDPDNSGRVNMDHLRKLVTTALQWTYAAGEKDVTTQTLEAVAEMLTLPRDAIRVIDAPGQRELASEQKDEAKNDRPKRKTRPRAGSSEGNAHPQPEVRG